MSIIQRYKETVKDTERRILFVMCYVEAWNKFASDHSPRDIHMLVPIEAVQRFTNYSRKPNSERFIDWRDADFEHEVLPVLRWFAYGEPLGNCLDTEQLDKNIPYQGVLSDFYISYFSERFQVNVMERYVQKFVMKEVAMRLQAHKEWLEDEERVSKK